MNEDLVSIAFLRDVVLFAAARGVAPEVLCARAGFSTCALSSPDQQIAGRFAEALWHAAVELTDDQDLGLHIGAASHVSSLGIVAPVLSNSPDLRGALSRLARYGRILISAVGLEVTRAREGRCAVRFPLVAANSYVRRSPRQPMECSIAAMLTVSRQLVGRAVPVLEVSMRHAAPPRTKEHSRVFDAPVRFDRAHDEIVLDAACLEWPVLLSNAKQLEFQESHVREKLSAASGDRPCTERSRRTIAMLLTGVVPTLDEVAERLGTSTRSLQRELAAEGTGFRAVLDEVRRDLALAHLESTEVSVAQVALLLGFSDARAFHRSFKRWTGTTPRARAGRAALS